MITKGPIDKKLIMMALAGFLLLLLAVGSSASQPPIVGENDPQGCSACETESLANMATGETPSAKEPLAFIAAEDVQGSVDLPDIPGLVPPAVTPVSPADRDTISTGNPTYTWTGSVSTPPVLFYCLEVSNSAGVVFKQCYAASDFATPPAACSVTPSVTLGPGDYTWHVQATNCDGNTWSATWSFSVCSSTSAPGRATLISPKWTIGTSKPTFVWRAVTGSTQYHLKVVNTAAPNTLLIDKWYNAEEVTSGQTCSILSEVTFGSGTYRWWIQTRNCDKLGPWSYYANFRFANVLPGKAIPISPRGLTTTSNPTFVWTAVRSATTYNLSVENNSGTFVIFENFPADEVTQGTRCSAALSITLPDDDTDYFWRVQASNDAGDGLWSSYKYFEIICSGKKTSSRNDREDDAKKRITRPPRSITNS